MLKHIVRKEMREITRDGRFRWGGALVGALLVFSLAAGWVHHQEVARSHAAAESMSWSQWLEQGDRNPHSAAHYGIYVFRPVSSLSLLDSGVDPYVGATTWLEAHYQNPFEHRAIQDTPALARFADFTAATTLQLLVPLLILLMAFQSFAGERERGTLRQLLGIGVDPRRLAIGKAVGVLVVTSILVVPAALLGAAALLMAGPSAGAVDDAGLRLALLAGIYLVYFALFALLAVAVSALSSSSRVSLAVLLCFWIVNGLLAPRISADIARVQVPLPTSLEFQTAIQEDLVDGFGPFPPRAERQALLQDSILTAHGVDDLASLPINFAGLSLQAGEEFGNLVFDRRFGELASRIDEQLELHRRLGVLAPHLAVRSLSMALTGTDPDHHQRYATAAEEHRRLIQRILNDDIMVNGRYGETYIADASLWQEIPEFQYAGPGVGWALSGQRTAVAILLLWILLGMIVARSGASTLPRRL